MLIKPRTPGHKPFSSPKYLRLQANSHFKDKEAKISNSIQNLNLGPLMPTCQLPKITLPCTWRGATEKDCWGQQRMVFWWVVPDATPTPTLPIWAADLVQSCCPLRSPREYCMIHQMRTLNPDLELLNFHTENNRYCSQPSLDSS